MDKTYYQPDKNGELPEELWSFQVFKTRQDCFDWLVQHDYDADEWNIGEYHDDDIEEPTFIDEYGDMLLSIEAMTDEDVTDMIIREVAQSAGGVVNLVAEYIRQKRESGKDSEDLLWETAHSKVMSAIEKIEKYDGLDFSSYWDDGEPAWYDRVREDVILRVCAIITGQEV